MVVLSFAAVPATAHHTGRNPNRPDLYPADPQAAGPRAPNPLLGARWFDGPDRQPSFKAYERLFQRGRPRDAQLIYDKIVRPPKFRWIGRHNRRPGLAVGRNLRYMRIGETTGLTVYAHEGEQCRRGYDGGGRRGERRYRRWIDEFAAAVDDARVIVAFEPDSLGTMRCLSPAGRRARLRNMRYGIDVLSRLPFATVYIEAGASDWRPASEMARYLRYVGIRKVRGFMLNVTHFDTTRRNVRYGARLSRMVGGKPFVVNTDENGRGPLLTRPLGGRRRYVWCNPRNSALGVRPTTRTGHPKADAFLWISRPGASAGPCRGRDRRYSMAGPPAGTFWVARALMLARRARW